MDKIYFCKTLIFVMTKFIFINCVCKLVHLHTKCHFVMTFVMTSHFVCKWVNLSEQKWVLPRKNSFLSWQNDFCRGKTHFCSLSLKITYYKYPIWRRLGQNDFCCDKINLVVTKGLFSWQKWLLLWQKWLLLWQNYFCLTKLTFARIFPSCVCKLVYRIQIKLVCTIFLFLLPKLKSCHTNLSIVYKIEFCHDKSERKITKLIFVIMKWFLLNKTH